MCWWVYFLVLDFCQHLSLPIQGQNLHGCLICTFAVFAFFFFLVLITALSALEKERGTGALKEDSGVRSVRPSLLPLIFLCQSKGKGGADDSLVVWRSCTPGCTVLSSQLSPSILVHSSVLLDECSCHPTHLLSLSLSGPWGLSLSWPISAEWGEGLVD